MKRRWIIKEQLNQSLAISLSKKWNFSRIMIQLLHNRGIEENQMEKFLHPSLKNLYDPFLMKGMERATDRILKAFSRQEKILIFGDYDADGVTATSFLLLFLKDLKVPAYFYIPQRKEEGYGLNKTAIDKAAKQGIDLIITCDCGTSSFREIKYAKDKGLEVVVTDHHRVRNCPPSSLTILNPDQPDCSYPFKKLAGVGVVFKLAQALTQKLPPEKGVDPYKYLDLVAMGTIADLVPLRDENRILVNLGLERLRDTSNRGLKALIEVTGLSGREIGETQVGFVLAPRLNACGRLSLAKKGVKLLLSTSSEEALRLARELSRENGQRRRIEEKMYREAEELLSGKKETVIILSKEGWHPGLIGLVASHLRERYFRPTIIFSRDGDVARGSARSIPEFPIFEALQGCSDLLLDFGGHKMAAGMDILVQNIDRLKGRLNEMAGQMLTPEDLTPSYLVDARINLEELNEKVFEELELLSPYGMENPAPLFLGENLCFSSPIKVMNKGCIRTSLSSEKGEVSFEAVGFGLDKGDAGMVNLEKADMIFTPRINRWKGKKTYQLEIKDWREVSQNL